MHQHHLAELSLISFFLMGFTGSLHCLGMCGPLSTLFLQENNTTTLGRQLARLLPYHLSRIFSYSLLALLFASAGIKIQTIVPKELFLFTFSALILVLIIKDSWIKIPQGLYRLLGTLTSKAKKYPPVLRACLLGTLTPLLPCGLLYAALSLAMITQHPHMAFFYLFSFGIGTSLPMILGQLGILKALQKYGNTYTAISKLAAIFALALSIYFLYRH